MPMKVSSDCSLGNSALGFALIIGVLEPYFW